MNIKELQDKIKNVKREIEYERGRVEFLTRKIEDRERELEELERQVVRAPERKLFRWGGYPTDGYGSYNQVTLDIGPWWNQGKDGVNRETMGIRVFRGDEQYDGGWGYQFPVFINGEGIDNIIAALAEWKEYGESLKEAESPEPPLWCNTCGRYHEKSDYLSYAFVKAKVDDPAYPEWTGRKPGD